MSVNKHSPHVFVLPEDDANHELAIGFLLGLDWTRQRQMQVLPVAGGWVAVLEHFAAHHVRKMESNAQRFMVLLIDFDRKDERFEYAKSKIPQHLQNRVFVVGVWSILIGAKRPRDLQRVFGLI